MPALPIIARLRRSERLRVFAILVLVINTMSAVLMAVAASAGVRDLPIPMIICTQDGLRTLAVSAKTGLPIEEAPHDAGQMIDCPACLSGLCSVNVDKPQNPPLVVRFQPKMTEALLVAAADPAHELRFRHHPTRAPPAFNV